MSKTLKYAIIFLAITALCFYLLPMLITNFIAAILSMYMVTPLVIFGTSFFFGRNCGFKILYVLLVAILFIPTIFIYYNASATIYLLIYGVISLLGVLLGSRFTVDHKI